MSFVKPLYKKPDDYLQDVQNDVIIPWLAVHDELDFVIDYNLLIPVMKKITRIAHCKEEWSKLSSIPYVNFLFDTEYDPWGSFTARSALKDDQESVALAKDAKELYWKKQYIQYREQSKSEPRSENKISVASSSNELNTSDVKYMSEGEVITKPVLGGTFRISDEKAFNLLLDIIDMLPDGDTEILFTLGDGRVLTNGRRVNISNFVTAFESNKS